MLSLLNKIQERHGYLPEIEINKLSHQLKIPLSRIYGIATFYKKFSLTPQGENLVICCKGAACHAKEGMRLLEALKKRLGIKEEQTTPDGKFTLKTTSCIGACPLAPTMMINKKIYGKLTPTEAVEILSRYGR